MENSSSSSSIRSSTSSSNSPVAASDADWYQYLTSYVPYLILGLWAIIANCLIVYSVGRDKSLRPKHQLVIALAVGELFIGLAIFTAGVGRLMYISAGTHLVKVDHISCFLRPWNPFFMIGYQLTALVTILISLERLACVAAPVKYYQLPSKLYIKYAIWGAVAFVLVSLASGFFTCYNLPNVINNICMTSDTFSSTYALYNYTICAISGVVTVLIYGLSAIVMQLNIRRLRSNTRAKSRLIAQGKVTRVMAIVLSSQFLLVALPNLGKMTAIIAKIDSKVLSAFWPYLSHVAVANSCVSIIIYAVFNAELQDAFRVAIGLSRKIAVSQGGFTLTIGPTNIVRVGTKSTVFNVV